MITLARARELLTDDRDYSDQEIEEMLAILKELAAVALEVGPCSTRYCGIDMAESESHADRKVR